MPSDKPSLKEVFALIRRTLDNSIPYVSKYNAFLIRAEDWTALADMVNPNVQRLNVLLEKQKRGEKLTPEEIEKGLEFTEVKFDWEDEEGE